MADQASNLLDRHWECYHYHQQIHATVCAQALRKARRKPGGNEPANGYPYLAVRELCGRLNVSRTSLWRWGVPGYQWRDSRRYRLSEVIEYLESAEFKRKAADLRAERRGTVSGSK